MLQVFHLREQVNYLCEDRDQRDTQVRLLCCCHCFNETVCHWQRLFCLHLAAVPFCTGSFAACLTHYAIQPLLTSMRSVVPSADVLLPSDFCNLQR